MDNRFPKKLRVLDPREFTRILGGGSYAADQTLVINVQRAAASSGVSSAHDGKLSSRLGISIPTKTGNAVVRNRWKRLIREAFRTQKKRLPQGYDIIVRPRRGAVAEFTRIQRSLLGLTHRAVQFSGKR